MMKSRKIDELVKAHERKRSEGINLIASENYLSPKIREKLSGDLAGRYHSVFYGGTEPAREIIARTEDLARELFGVKHVIVESLSGNVCDLAVLFAFTEPYDHVAMLPFEAGGYPLGFEKFHRKRVSIPYNEETLEIDVERCRDIFEREHVELTILGSSYIPFPHPVKEISGMIDDGTCVYDGSHVLGLIACGEFQDPMDEGADIMIGSTHKTFYGPQGGLILTNSSHHHQRLRQFFDIDVETGIGLVDNPHVNRIAALGAAMEEILDDQGYGKRVVNNAKALAKALDDLGIPVKYKERGYTKSHQIFLDIPENKTEYLCRHLEKNNIFIDIASRIGTAELTHRGKDEEYMEEVAHRIARYFPQELKKG